MEPNNFERQLKQKLENSTIQPSGKAWDQLEAMLDTADKVKDKRNYTWIYMAASFIGLLIISSVFFNQTVPENINKSNPVVLEQHQIKTGLEKSNESKEEEVLSQKENSAIVTNEHILEKGINKKVSNHLKETEVVISVNNDKVVNVVSPETKVSEAIRKNKYMSAENLLAAVSDTKVEVKTACKSFKKGSVGSSVDPNSLLSSVEKELNQSYKESALEKFNKKFNAVKTALVNRNYQE
jgi:hypothetical protein